MTNEFKKKLRERLQNKVNELVNEIGRMDQQIGFLADVDRLEALHNHKLVKKRPTGGRSKRPTPTAGFNFNQL